MDIIKENGTTLLTLNKISNWNKAFDLHFNRIMFTSQWDWEQYFLTMEHQGLVMQPRQTSQRGTPLDMDHFIWKIFTRTLSVDLIFQPKFQDVLAQWKVPTM